MDCPRCETDLTAYTLPDTESVAVVCDRCGFADVPASSRGEVSAAESWEHAIERFERIGRLGRESNQSVRTTSVSLPESGEESETEVSLDMAAVSVEAVLTE